jgi:hypothetical protein
MVIHPQPAGNRVDVHSLPQSGIFVTLMFLGWLQPEWIKQLLLNPHLRKTLRLRK